MNVNEIILKEKSELVPFNFNQIISKNDSIFGFDDDPPEIFPIVKTLLSDGEIVLNGKRMMIPVGSCGAMTVKEFRKLANIPRKNDVFVINENGALYTDNSDTIEISDGATFTHRRPQPAAPFCVPARSG